MDKNLLKSQSEYYKSLYKNGKCTREIAKENIQPYLDFINETSKKLCKKYNQKHKNVSFSSYVR